MAPDNEDALSDTSTVAADMLSHEVKDYFPVASEIVPTKATPAGATIDEASLRLRLALVSRVEQTCEKLREAFERKLAVERERHEMEWRETENRLRKELDLKLYETTEAAKERFEFTESRKKVLLSRRSLICHTSAGDVVEETSSPTAASSALLREKLADKEAELDILYATYKPTLEAQRRAQAKLLKAREAALALKVPVKVMGVLDPVLLVDAGLRAEEISALQERLRHPDFHPFKTVIDGDDARLVPDLDHPELVALRYEYGFKVCDEVIRCVSELDAWNPSGRYHVAIPWDSATDSELDPADVIRHLGSAPRPREDDENATSRRQPPRGLLSSSSSSSGEEQQPEAATTTSTTNDARRRRSRRRAGNAPVFAADEAARPENDDSSQLNTTATARLLASRGATRAANNAWTRRTMFSFWGTTTNASSSSNRASSLSSSSSSSSSSASTTTTTTSATSSTPPANASSSADRSTTTNPSPVSAH